MNFPFGAPVSTLRQSPLACAKLFILGVYASAVHARWINPDGSSRHQALAVASEPSIFWDGENAKEIISRISMAIPAEAGRLAPPGPQMNGPSGRALDKHYLLPLGLTRNSAWLCDLLPESRMNEGQVLAVKNLYDPIRDQLGLPRVTVPLLPSRFANGERLEQIVGEFLSSGAPIFVTLGDKPLEEFISRLRLMNKASIGAFGRTEAEYGRLHPFTLMGRKFELLPLVHPRQAAGLGWHSPALKRLHESWVLRVRKELLA